MAVKNPLPTSELKAEDIRDTVGGTNDLTSFFTVNLNETSKYKPVRYAVDFSDGNERWKSSGNCGFTFPNSSNVSDVPNWYKNPTYESDSNRQIIGNGWEYKKPRGKSGSINEPMRLGDFRGYSTTVIPMTQAFYAPEKGQMKTGATLSCTCMLANQSETNISIKDLDTLAASYFGVYAVNNSDTSKTRTAYATTQGSGTVELPCHDMNLGKWTLYPFFANSSKNKFYPVPYVEPRTVEMVSSTDAIEMRIEGTLSADLTTCTWKVYAKNTSGATTLSNNSVYFKFSGNDLSTNTQQNEKSWSSSTGITIPSSSTMTVVASGTFTGTTLLGADMGSKLWFSFGGGRYTGSSLVTRGTGDRT